MKKFEHCVFPPAFGVMFARRSPNACTAIYHMSISSYHRSSSRKLLVGQRRVDFLGLPGPIWVEFTEPLALSKPLCMLSKLVW